MNIEQKMSSKEIADLTGKRHDHVVRDIKKMYDELDLGVPTFGGTYYSKQHKAIKCCILSRREVEILITGYSIKLRAKVIDRLKEVEQELAKQIPVASLPGNYKEALLALVEAEEEKERQQLLIEEQKPSVQFCEQVSQAKNDLLIRDFAKALSKDGFKIGQNRLFDYLRESKVLMSNNQPYQRFIDNGYFNVVTRVVQTNHGVITKYTPMITGKGQLALSKKLLSEV